jgi:hypothetical protein
VTSAPADRAIEQLLWHDENIFYQQTEKSAAVLLALKSVFERANWTDETTSEFLDLLKQLTAFDAAAFTRVWQQPFSHVWIRRAFHLAQASIAGIEYDNSLAQYCRIIGRDEPRAALDFHLEQFKAIALGVAAVAQADINFERPLRLELPFVVPGTPYSISGEGFVQLWGIENGCLLVEASQFCGRLRLEKDACLGDYLVDECAQVTVDDYTVLLNANAFRITGFDFCTPVLKAGNGFQLKQTQLAYDTIQYIQRFDPESFRQFSLAIVSIAFKPEEEGSYQNISHSALPGAFFCVPIDNPLALADKFIHELHHNRLFAIEAKHGEFFSAWQLDPSHAPRYYSPWRDDLRPLHGLIHAVYVHVPVLRYWLEVYQADDVRDLDRPFVVCQLLITAERLRLGIGVLSRFAEFTNFGRELFDQLQHDVGELRHRVAELDLNEESPALEVCEDGSYRPAKADGRALDCREIIAEHVLRFDKENHTEGLTDASHQKVVLKATLNRV